MTIFVLLYSCFFSFFERSLWSSSRWSPYYGLHTAPEDVVQETVQFPQSAEPNLRPLHCTSQWCPLKCTLHISHFTVHIFLTCLLVLHLDFNIWPTLKHISHPWVCRQDNFCVFVFLYFCISVFCFSIFCSLSSRECVGQDNLTNAE